MTDLFVDIVDPALLFKLITVPMQLWCVICRVALNIAQSRGKIWDTLLTLSEEKRKCVSKRPRITFVFLIFASRVWDREWSPAVRVHSLNHKEQPV